LEGIAFGQDVTINDTRMHTLYVSNDNDYLAKITDDTHPDGVENPNTLYVFAFTNDDLPGFEPQKIKPYYLEDSCDLDGVERTSGKK
jgi:hypothetical protein